MTIFDEPWTSWCRLCANSCEKSLNFSTDSKQAIHFLRSAKQFLSLSLKEETQLPQHVCSECNNNINQFEEFAENCVRVQSMFKELNQLRKSNVDVKSIRLKYHIKSADGNEDSKNQLLNWEEEKSFEVTEIGLDALDVTYSDSNDSNGIPDDEVYEITVPDKVTINYESPEETNATSAVRIQCSPNIDFKSETPVLAIKTEHECGIKSEERFQTKEILPTPDQSSPLKSSKTAVSKTRLSFQFQSKKRDPKSLTGAAKRKSKRPLPAFKELDSDENTFPKENENPSALNSDLVDSKLNPIKISKKNSKFVFQCHLCNNKWDSWGELSRHCKLRHDSAAHVICICGKKLRTIWSIKEHRRKHSPESVFRCDYCEKEFYRKTSLNTHVMSHIPKEEQPYVCKNCSRRFHCEILLRNHEKIHLPREERLLFSCEVCEKTFCSKSAVATHVKTVHFGQKPFVCDICQNSFATKGILQEHVTIHSEDLPWVCDICSKGFKTKYRLKTHMDIHSDTFSCPHCPAQLSTRRTLRMHLAVHQEVKAYQCTLCDKAFRRSKDLKIHSNLHTGEKPYSCPFCSRTFANGSNCRSHKKRMHPDELREYEAALDQNKHETYRTINLGNDPAFNDSDSSSYQLLNQDSENSMISVKTCLDESTPVSPSHSSSPTILNTYHLNEQINVKEITEIDMVPHKSQPNS